MRAIGSGFQCVLFADVRTVADARACVAAVRAETPGSGGLLGVACGATLEPSGKAAHPPMSPRSTRWSLP